ncbi:MAG: PgaD family protein, partial [Planctomycetaceae bacterium]|nr:PgaD family protein [Planctomycetaceae bacterium]
MSQTEFDQTLSTVSKKKIGNRGVRIGYRAVSVLAILAFLFSLFTPLMLLSNWFVLFPLFGMVCGLVGLYNILSCPFDYTGRNFALTGIIFSLVLGLGASGWGIYNYYFFIPYGYTAVSFLELRPDA